MKILILKPSSLGDVVQALPVLRLLKSHWPKCEVHWWIAPGLASLFDGDPHVSRMIPFHRQRWRSPRHWAEMVRSILEIRRQRYDLVIDLQGLARSGIFAWLSNATTTIGLADHREGARGFYDLSVDRPFANAHAVNWYLRVVEKLGLPVHDRFEWLPLRQDVAMANRNTWPTNGMRWLALCPGARWLNKRWPTAYFCELVRLLGRKANDLRFVILGGPEDQEMGSAIAQSNSERCLDLTGKTTLPQLIEWVRACDGMVTNDTGPMHIAAALGMPVVAVFGPTDPAQTGPFGQLGRALQNREIPCVPCLKSHCRHTSFMECLTSLDASRVANRVEQILVEGCRSSQAR